MPNVHHAQQAHKYRRRIESDSRSRRRAPECRPAHPCTSRTRARIAGMCRFRRNRGSRARASSFLHRQLSRLKQSSIHFGTLPSVEALGQASSLDPQAIEHPFWLGRSALGLGRPSRVSILKQSSIHFGLKLARSVEPPTRPVSILKQSSIHFGTIWSGEIGLPFTLSRSSSNQASILAGRSASRASAWDTSRSSSNRASILAAVE